MSRESRTPPEPEISDEDTALFRSAVRGVRALHGGRVERRAPPPTPRADFRRRDERAVVRELGECEPTGADVETGEELSYGRPGLRPGVLRRLRRGQYPLQAELDLHGLTVPEAHDALADFLRECAAEGTRCVRVIHGKGLRSAHRGPVLKGKVNLWLRRRDEVLAFVSARPADGGTGAVYVLLRVP
ncbi:MAG TPA: Smr/MutS family protein [Gammaproteobacteria bacterium]|nr:Smr/MutS family protein [Gammaproteobacteria bacterium]